MAQINSKEIQKSLQDDVNARKDSTEKLKNFNDAVESASNKQKETQLVVEKLKMSYQQQIAAGEDASKLSEELTKKQKEASDAITELDLAKRDKENFDAKYQQESLASLDRIGNNVLQVSPEEMELRRLFQESIDIEKEQAALLRADPLRQDQADAADANIKAKEEKETKRRDKAQTKGFQKGLKGIADGLKDFGEGMKKTAELTLKGGLLIAAYFAIAKFLQSPMFGQLVSFIKEKIIPAFTAMFDYFMKPGGIFDSLMVVFQAVLDIVGGLFDIITGIFTGDFALIGEGLMAVFGGLFDVIMAVGGAIMGVVGDLISGLFNLIVDIFVGIFNFVDNLTGGMFTNIMSTIMSAVEMFTGGFTKIFSGDILGGLADIIISPFKMIGELAANVFRGIIDTILNVINYLPGVNIKNPFDEVPKPPPETELSDNIAKSAEIQKGGEKDPARFVTNKQNEDMMMRRKEEMMDEKRAVNNVNNQTVVNNVSTGGTTQQINSTRYVKDQSSVFQSNNA